MKFESITDMYKYFGCSVPRMRDYINKRLSVHQVVVSPQDFINQTMVNRNVTINGFTLREIDAFIEGQLSIIEEMKDDLVNNLSLTSFNKWLSMLSDEPITEDSPMPDYEPGVTVYTIDTEDADDPIIVKPEVKDAD